MTWLAILLLVPLVYIVLAVYDVQRHAFAATAAARARSAPCSTSGASTNALPAARAAAEVALADQDVDAGDVDLRLSCRPAGDCLAPGSVVHVEVRTQVALPLVPTALGDDVPSIRVDAQHTVPYGTFREDRS